MRKISLDDSWNLKSQTGDINLPVNVPSTVYEILCENEIIENPFYAVNEDKVQWVYEKEWIYEREFEICEKDLNSGDVSLIFYGLDTFADIYLNSKLIGKTSNMHIKYDFQIKNKLINGINRIEVVFNSSTEEVRNRLKKVDIDIEDENIRKPYEILGVESIRKAYFSYGWDWGPKLPDIGIWRNVELVIHDSPEIENLKIETDIEFNDSSLSGMPRADSAGVSFNFDLVENGYDLNKMDYRINITKGSELIAEKLGKISIKNEIKITLKNPSLWWTHDLGEQNLYEAEIKVLYGAGRGYTFKQRFGIRKIELVRDEDKWGETFYFRLNGIPVFAKGANWIPSDSFIPRGRKNDLIGRILTDAKKANMNMIRIWGGGIYEDDEFYSFCDENGLLVWQDFAFACKPTPNFERLIENIEKEAEYNIKRLRNHPSLAVWVGNNEIEEGWLYWGFDKFVPQFKPTYSKIFEDILPKIAGSLDGSRAYWPSSPSSGGNFDDPRSPDKGDSHYWMVWHAMYPFKSYREFDSRFMSEFGFESFPSMKTIREFCTEDQLYMNSEIMEAHQKNPAGNGKILAYMQQRFSIPNDFEKQVVISQITQAEAMEYGVEHWRRNRNDFHCMGALYWQLNDCWPVASWSSIDYYGRWKALHYYAKRFYNPLFVSGEEDDKGIRIFITNDTPADQELVLKWQLYKTDGTFIGEGERKTTSPRLSSFEVGYVPLEECRSDEAIAFFEIFDVNGVYVSRGSKLFTAPKELELKEPKLGYEIQKLENEVYNIEITTENVALYVHIDSEEFDIESEDNFFNMKPGEIVKLNFKTSFEGSAEELKDNIYVNSLWQLLN